MKAFTSTTLRRLRKLTPKARTEVIKIVTRHVAACQRAGFQSESLEQVVLEAMDVVARGQQGEYEDGQEGEWAQLSGEVRRYEQYRSPVDSRVM